jgi:hypothetical protein
VLFRFSKKLSKDKNVPTGENSPKSGHPEKELLFTAAIVLISIMWRFCDNNIGDFSNRCYV